MNTITTQERVETGIALPTRAQITAVRAMLDQLEGTAGDAAKAPANVTAPVTRKRKDRAMNATAPVYTASGTPAPNAPTFEELLLSAAELGQQAGQGGDVQIKFDLKLCEAAYLGSLSLDTNKHGNDVDDATRLSEAYWKARNGAVIFDAKADKQRKTISNARKMIKLGSTPKWGVGEPMSTVNQLITIRQTLRKDPANSKKLDDAHNMLMRFATAQLKLDTLLDANALRTFAFKKDPDARTAEDVLEGIRKIANKLKVGKIANCPDLDNSQEVQAIINACTKRLTSIAKARAPQGAPTA